MDEPGKKFSWKHFEPIKFKKGGFSKRVRKIEKTSLRHAKKFVTTRLDRLSLVRRVVVGWMALIVILAGVSLAQWFSFRQAYMVKAPASGGTYSEGVLGPLESLNPIFARTSAERSAAKLLFASLYSYDSTGHIKSDLAKSLTINDTQTEYTVTLRSGLKWSDGAPLTVKDVIFTANLLKNSQVRSEISGWETVTVEQADPGTVRFKLPGAYAPFIQALNFPILPEHVLSEVEASTLHEYDFSQNPVTSGPFALRLLQSLSSDGSKKIVHMVANPNYHLGKAKLDRFQLYVYKDRSEIEKGLRTSEIIATPELNYKTQPEALKRNLVSQSQGINNGVYALFNTTSELLRDKNIREALSISVDRSEVMETISSDAISLDGPVLGNQVSDLPKAETKNVARAKQALDSAGWIDDGKIRSKDGVELAIRLVALKDTGPSQAVSSLAKMWQSELHIKVEIQMLDPLDSNQSVLQTVLQPRNFDVLVYELVLGGDPDSYAYWHSSQANPNGLNFSNYSNVIADDALAGARTRTDASYRDDRYRTFAKRWLSDVPAVALYQPKIDYIHSENVEALNENAQLVSAEDRFSDVLYWSVDKSLVHKTP